jgi:peptide/nickel transport system substrate-binding protein
MKAPSNLRIGRALAAVTAAAALIAAAGCDSAVKHSQSSTGGGAAQSGGTLQVGTTTDLVPAAIFTNSNDAINLLIGQVYDSLIDYPADSLNAKPSLATSWHLAPDGKSLTLNLRKGVTFHTGRKFTSKDVEFSIKTWADPKWTVQFQRTAAAITGFDTSKPYQITLKFDHPLSNVLDLLDIMPIIDQSTFSGLEKGTQYVGTGPFEFVSWKPQSEIVLKRNPHYWRGTPKLDGVDIHVISDAQSLVSELRSGQLDAIIGAGNRDLQTLSKTGSFDAIPFKGSERQTYVGVNVDNPYLKNYKLREAIAYAVDRKRIVDEIYRGVGYPIALPWPTYSPAYNAADNKLFAQNIAKAKALVHQVGKIPTLPLEYSTANPNWEAIAQIVQSNLKAVGINVQLIPNENSTQIDRLIGGKFPALWIQDHAYAQYTPSTLAVTAYPFNADNNTSHFVNKKYQQDANAAWETPDGQSKTALHAYAALNHDLLSSLFLIELSATYEEMGTAGYVHGVTWTKRSEPTFGGAWLDK